MRCSCASERPAGFRTQRVQAGQNKYSPKRLEASRRALTATRELSQLATVAVVALRAGMILDEDINVRNGVLIAPRGFEVTASFLLHLRKFEGKIDREKVKVLQVASTRSTAVPQSG
jgi:hypothetical protein